MLKTTNYFIKAIIENMNTNLFIMNSDKLILQITWSKICSVWSFCTRRCLVWFL